MHKRRTLTVMTGAVAVALVASACGGGNSGSSSSSSGASGRGPITYVQGKDNAGLLAPQIARWNAAHPTEKVTAKEQSDKADQQHDDLVQHFRAKDPSYDVVSVDVVWTAEFAAKGWLTPLKDKLALPTIGFLAPTINRHRCRCWSSARFARRVTPSTPGSRSPRPCCGSGPTAHHPQCAPGAG